MGSYLQTVIIFTPSVGATPGFNSWRNYHQKTKSNKGHTILLAGDTNCRGGSAGHLIAAKTLC